jgi:hypothetical protein
LIKVDAEGMSALFRAWGRRTPRRDRPLVAAEAAAATSGTLCSAVLSALGSARWSGTAGWRRGCGSL